LVVVEVKLELHLDLIVEWLSIVLMHMVCCPHLGRELVEPCRTL
jgi:hypothetical protein